MGLSHTDGPTKQEGASLGALLPEHATLAAWSAAALVVAPTCFR